ncbi:hypothetical protein V1512DRAFT_256357 [Lipomyces arxii]|uniref:uncharacterized protein n=1 Tax=Lipomyces arxii TaxID=56418 RepID=UPI0034CDF56F
MSYAQWIKQFAANYRLKIAGKDSRPSPFVQELDRLAKMPLVYEDQELLDLALDTMPLDRLYAEAERESTKDETWGMQDHLIRALLKWFRNDFFTWVNAPKCSSCSAETEGLGGTSPTPQERADSAGRVELYKCKSCGAITRFPRYGHPRKLLTFRQGRCGEWANCFTLLCRALGSRARWVWNTEDHVWTEVYSEKQKRWIHADSCETAWDQPRLYEQGWGKKMSYAIAFSVEGAVDVSKKYIRTAKCQLPRKRITEIDLYNTLQRITTQRRAHLPPSEQAALQLEDEDEQAELYGYSNKLTPASTSEMRPRATGAGAWTAARGEDGKH